MPTYGGSSDAAVQLSMNARQQAREASSLQQEVEYTNLLLEALLRAQGIALPEHPAVAWARKVEEDRVSRKRRR